MLAVRPVFQSANLPLVSPSTDLFAAGTDALERGAWEEARTHLQASVGAGETPQALKQLGLIGLPRFSR